VVWISKSSTEIVEELHATRIFKRRREMSAWKEGSVKIHEGPLIWQEGPGDTSNRHEESVHQGDSSHCFAIVAGLHRLLFEFLSRGESLFRRTWGGM